MEMTRKGNVYIRNHRRSMWKPLVYIWIEKCWTLPKAIIQLRVSLSRLLHMHAYWHIKEEFSCKACILIIMHLQWKRRLSGSHAWTGRSLMCLIEVRKQTKIIMLVIKMSILQAKRPIKRNENEKKTKKQNETCSL